MIRSDIEELQKMSMKRGKLMGPIDENDYVISRIDSNILHASCYATAKSKGTTQHWENAVANIVGKSKVKQPTPQKAPAAGPSKIPPTKTAGSTKSSTSLSGVTHKRPSD